MASYKDDRKWSDECLPQLKKIVHDVLSQSGHVERVTTAPTDEDNLRNTDLIVFNDTTGKRVGCRVRRRDERYDEYWRQVTFRFSRDSGKETELSKLERGWGDVFVYGWAKDKKVTDWRVIDLSKFRQYMKDYPDRGIQRNNHDGSSDFLAYDTSLFTAGIEIETNGFLDKDKTVKSVTPIVSENLFT